MGREQGARRHHHLSPRPACAGERPGGHRDGEVGVVPHPHARRQLQRDVEIVVHIGSAPVDRAAHPAPHGGAEREVRAVQGRVTDHTGDQPEVPEREGQPAEVPHRGGAVVEGGGAAHGGEGLVGGERGIDAGEPVGRRDRVGVEAAEDVRPGGVEACRRGAGDPRRARAHEAGAVLDGDRRAAVGAAVVDDDHLVGGAALAVDRREAPVQRLRVVAHGDDDGDPHQARPRAERAAPSACSDLGRSTRWVALAWAAWPNRPRCPCGSGAR